jgi:predicted nucleic acid-binding protein
MTAPALVKHNAWVDTNIWFYALSAGDEAKRIAANHLLDALDHPIINSQVIRELSINLLRKSAYDETAIQDLATSLYRDCHVVPESVGVFLRASELRKQHAFSYWDSLIVAAALEAGCKTIYSEDMQHGQLIDGQLTIVNPFAGA